MGLSGSVLYKVRGASSSAGKERETTGSGAETQSQVPDRGIIRATWCPNCCYWRPVILGEDR